MPKKDLEIYADFIDNGTCNAVAGIYHKMGLIGIFKGAIMLPAAMFYNALSHPGVLEGIGNSRGEKVGLQHREGIPTDYDELMKIRRKVGTQTLTEPIDPIRLSVSQICTELVWNFIFLHELTHIVHGHVEYGNLKKRNPYLLEISPPIKSRNLSRKVLDRQSIELWADSKSVSMFVKIFLESTSGRANEIFPERKAKLFIWSFAIFTLFRIWGISIDVNSMTNTDHPPTAARFDLAMESASIEVTHAFPELAGEFWNTVQSGQAEAEKAIVLCGGNRLRPEDIAGINDPKTKQHMDAVLKHAADVLFPGLQKYSHVQNAKATDPATDAKAISMPSLSVRACQCPVAYET